MSTFISVDSGARISKIDERIYSSFIEHMGRAVYTGVYEPGHPSADEYGFRGDVESLILPLGLSHIRYPGGNFLSGYRWLDGVGPKETRPVRPDLAWFALEPNQIGVDEFLQWCERIHVSAMLGVNLGTGTPQSACDLLEYVNGDFPTQYANLRRQNGREAPYRVKLWCLGNEMDGPWQICAKTAEEYGRIACETAKMMKRLDPSIELVACGSSFRSMPTFGAWERTVLNHCYPYVDYLSLHQYYQNNDGDIPSFLACSAEMDGFIREVAQICREAKAGQDGNHEIYLSFDEWNVWYHFQKSGAEPPKWTVARPIEEEPYDLADALVVGCMLNTLLRNADTVKIACLAQLVNVIAPIMTEPGGRAWIQTIYYPFLYASRYGRGTALSVQIESPVYDCKAGADIPLIDCAAVLSDDELWLTLFLVNRSLTDEQSCKLSLADYPGLSIGNCVSLTAPGTDAVNTASEAPVQPKTLAGAKADGNEASFTLPPFSWNMLRFALPAREKHTPGKQPQDCPHI